MVTNDTGLLQSIFMFGGAPPRRMLNSVVAIPDYHHRDTENTEIAQRRILPRTAALTATPAVFPARRFNTPVECCKRGHHEKQERIRSRVQREVEKTVHQHSET